MHRMSWHRYGSVPLNSVTGHTEYAAELGKIAVSYREYMGWGVNIEKELQLKRY